MAENITGMESSSCGGNSQFSVPSSLRCTFWGFLPRYTLVSIGSRKGSIEGLVTCEALIRILSQYTGRGFGLPMDDNRTPPLFACLYISLIVSFCQFAFSRKVQSLFTIFKALVGQRETQRWQLTHLDSSHFMILCSSS